MLQTNVLSAQCLFHPLCLLFEGQRLTRATELNATSISLHLKGFNHCERWAINSWSHALPIIPLVLSQKFAAKILCAWGQL